MKRGIGKLVVSHGSAVGFPVRVCNTAAVKVKVGLYPASPVWSACRWYTFTACRVWSCITPPAMLIIKSWLGLVAVVTATFFKHPSQSSKMTQHVTCITCVMWSPYLITSKKSKSSWFYRFWSEIAVASARKSLLIWKVPRSLNVLWLFLYGTAT